MPARTTLIEAYRRGCVLADTHPGWHAAATPDRLALGVMPHLVDLEPADVPSVLLQWFERVGRGPAGDEVLAFVERAESVSDTSVLELDPRWSTPVALEDLAPEDRWDASLGALGAAERAGRLADGLTATPGVLSAGDVLYRGACRRPWAEPAEVLAAGLAACGLPAGFEHPALASALRLYAALVAADQLDHDAALDALVAYDRPWLTDLSPPRRSPR